MMRTKPGQRPAARPHQAQHSAEPGDQERHRERSVIAKCTHGHNKAEQRCSSRCRLWYWVLSLPPGPDGNRRRQWSNGFKTKKEAEQALTEELRRRDQGIILNPENITVRQFMERWLDHMAT